MSDKDKGYLTTTNVVLGISLMASVGGGLYLYKNLNSAQEQIELLKKQNEALTQQLEEAKRNINMVNFNIQTLSNTFSNRIESLERSQHSFELSERRVVRPKRITLPTKKPVQTYEEEVEEEDPEDDDDALLAKMAAEEKSLLRR